MLQGYTRRHIFEVEISSFHTVGRLRTLIKDQLPEGYSSVQPSQLALYYIPLLNDDELDRKLEDINISQYPELQSTSPLTQVLHDPLMINHLHIIVRLPEGRHH